MNSNHNHKLALFFALLFITIVGAPSIIISMDDSVDVTIFYGESEEEEEKENLKLHFEFPELETENSEIVKSILNEESYLFKSYQKLYKNVHIPPPDYI